MPMSVETLRRHLVDAFPDAEIAIDDLAGEGAGDNAGAVMVAVAGLPRVRQHQMVYAALKGQMGGELHALALETSAPPGEG